MSEDQSINLAMGVGVLVLALSALSARRLSPWLVLRSLVSWVLIFGLVYVAVLNRDVLQGAVFGLEQRLTYGEQTVEGGTVRIRLSPDGHFWANAVVNGKPMRLLIDSGATITALSQSTAERAGVEVGDGGLPVAITTANGTVPAKRGNIDRLEVGALTAENLPVVVSPAFGDINVLGMNFLERLRSWRVEGRTLILEPEAGSQGHHGERDAMVNDR